ncbi:MAG TPA: chloride channel protein [Dehalococcoidia bacterium]|nr:chloride channel protein [Dehalococcoidia bacterium]
MTLTFPSLQACARYAAARVARVSEVVDARLLTLALVVGTLSGLGAVALAKMLQFVDWLAFDRGRAALSFLGDASVLFLPAAGGLLVGPLVYYAAREARGHGVPEVILAVETAGGRIRPHVAAVKALASAITIGTGGSAGREGPIVQIGASLGSSVGQLLKLGDDHIRLLLAAGAAGGIAATFNAPIAGMFFAVEVILRRFTTRNFTVIIVAAVMANVMYSTILGDHAVVAAPQYRLHDPLELLFYAGLGVAAAVAGMAFVGAVYGLEEAFDRSPLPPLVKPALGGLAVGAIGVWSLHPLGAGITGIEEIVNGGFATRTLICLFAAKLAATSFTLGSGGSGGVFAPSLFMGAALGAALGRTVHALAPDVAPQPEAYAVVGMAALFAAAARAPVTSVLIIFEITRDYRLIAPLMLAVAIATVVAQVINRETIYTIKLIRRGIDIQRERTGYLLDGVALGELLRPAPTVEPTVTVRELVELFSESDDTLAVVHDERGRLLGLVDAATVQQRLAVGETEVTAGELASRDFPRLHPDHTIHDALARSETADADAFAIVSRSDPQRVLGIVTRRDMLRMYARLARREDERSRRTHLAPLLSGSDTVLITYAVEPSSWLVGKRLSEVALPPGSLVVSIRRGGQTLIPRGQVRIERSDLLVILTLRTSEDHVRSLLQRGPVPVPGQATQISPRPRSAS